MRREQHDTLAQRKGTRPAPHYTNDMHHLGPQPFPHQDKLKRAL